MGRAKLGISTPPPFLIELKEYFNTLRLRLILIHNVYPYKPALVMGGMILGLGHSILKYGKVNQSPVAEVLSKFLFMTEIARKYLCS